MELTAGVRGLPRRRLRFPLLPLVLVLAGLALIAAFAGDLTLNAHHQQRLDQGWRQAIAVERPPSTPVDPAVTPQPLNGVDFAVRVPKLGYFAAVQEGVDSGVLAAGPGHYPATPWPGQTGNVGVAAHNTYWIKFGEL